MFYATLIWRAALYIRFHHKIADGDDISESRPHTTSPYLVQIPPYTEDAPVTFACSCPSTSLPTLNSGGEGRHVWQCCMRTQVVHNPHKGQEILVQLLEGEGRLLGT